MVLTRALAVRKPSVCRILRGCNQDADPHEVSKQPASPIPLADGGRNSSLSCWCLCFAYNLFCLEVSADPSYVYLRQPMKRADLAASVSRFRRSWAFMSVWRALIVTARSAFPIPSTRAAAVVLPSLPHSYRVFRLLPAA
jgi:hypothetical protein